MFLSRMACSVPRIVLTLPDRSCSLNAITTGKPLRSDSDARQSNDEEHLPKFSKKAQDESPAPKRPTRLKNDLESLEKKGKALLMSPRPTCTALQDYHPESCDVELSFDKGDVIQVIDIDESGWAQGMIGKRVGWFPATYVEIPESVRKYYKKKIQNTVDTESILDERVNVSEKLTNFLASRPKRGDLTDANILFGAQKQIEKEKKQTILGNLFNRRKMESSKGSRSNSPSIRRKFKKGIFGVDFNELLVEEPVPFLVSQCTQWILENGVHEEGIFRMSGSMEEIQSAKKGLRASDSRVDFSKCSVHSVCDLLKVFLRELPEPLIPWEFHSVLKDAMREVETTDDLKSAKEIIKLIPVANQQFLNYLFEFLKVVAQEDNKMSSENLAIIFTAIFMRPKTPGIPDQSLVPLISHYIEIGCIFFFFFFTTLFHITTTFYSVNMHYQQIIPE